jgi:hypothetical protein
VFADRGDGGVGEWHHHLAVDQLGDQPGLWDHGDVGCVETALDALAQVADEVGASRVVHRDAGRLLETTQGCREVVGLDASVGAEHVDRLLVAGSRGLRVVARRQPDQQCGRQRCDDRPVPHRALTVKSSSR